MKFELNIRNRIFIITEKDRVMFNGRCYSLETQTYFYNWNRVSPTLAKAKCKKWIKEGKLVKCGNYNCSDGTSYPMFKFLEEVE